MPFNGIDRKFNESGDPSNQAAQQTKHYIDIYHVQSENSISFKAMLTDYSDSYETQYEINEVSGQPDINQYKSMQRKVSFSIDIPAASEKEAETNMRRCGELIRMLNSAKDGTEGVQLYKSFKIRFANFLIDSEESSGNPQGFAVADKTGVSCYIDSFNFNPDLEAGFFSSEKFLLPKLIKCSFNIRVQKPASYQEMKMDDKKNKYFQGDKGARYYPFGLDGMQKSTPIPSNTRSPASEASVGSAIGGNDLLVD